jgi:hypothetical protein
LQDCTKRFDPARDVLKSHIGCPIFLLNYVTQMDIFDETNLSIIEKCQDKGYNQFLAYAYLENSD